MFNIKKKIVTFVIGFTMVLGLIPTINVQAAIVTNSTQSTLSKQAITAISKLDKTKKTIVIDPGHNYGGDLGAEVTNNGVTYKEVDLNMQVASKLKVELEKRGYNVVMTRYEAEKPMIGVNQSLRDRVVIGNNAKADFFISIHHNSILMAGVKGIETYYSSEEQSEDFKGGAVSNKLEISKKMATIINDSIAKNLNLNNRGAKDASLFIRSTNMPSIIVECGFITNQEDAKRCANPLSQQKLAEAIADAIKANIKSTK
ncbi:N-acetylmuramoyl-L-alanine amidase [Clostridium beijerinckii]|nr:N-acetylmuramoyl-L-alanine amidase [Clostridium beijerinckii]